MFAKCMCMIFAEEALDLSPDTLTPVRAVSMSANTLKFLFLLLAVSVPILVLSCFALNTLLILRAGATPCACALSVNQRHMERNLAVFAGSQIIWLFGVDMINVTHISTPLAHGWRATKCSISLMTSRDFP